MKNKIVYILAAFSLLAFAGCKDNGPEIDSDQYKSQTPKNVTLLDYSATSLTIAWDLVQGATSYTIQLTDMEMNPYSENHIATVTTVDFYEFSGLSASQAFYGRVRANYPYSGTSDWVYVATTTGEPAMLIPGVGILDLSPQLKLHASTSSTLTFEWSFTGDAASDAAAAYNLELYRDENCTDLEVSWLADGALTSDKGIFTAIAGYPVARFTFSGLDAGKTYYGRVTHTGYDIATPVLGATTEQTIVAATTNATAQTGDVILSHDFAKFIHGGDLVNSAAGYNAVSGTEYRQVWSKATGVNPTDDGSRPVVASGTEFHVWTGGTSAEYREALGMTDWGYASGSNISTRPGYVKIGGSGAVGSLFTPALSKLPANSTITLTFSASVYAEGGVSHSQDVLVRAVDGTTVSNNVVSGGVVVDTKLVDISESLGRFDTYSVTLNGVSPTTRISIGSNPELTSKTRFMLDDVVIVYDGASVLTQLAVPANAGFDPEAVFGDKLTLKWDAVADAASYTVAYWADGTPEAGATVVEGLTATNYTLTELTSETTYNAKVKACRYNNPDYDSAYSPVVSQATSKEVQPAGINVYKVLSTSSTLTVEWDRVDGQALVNSASQVYRVAIYNDSKGEDLVVSWNASNVFTNMNGRYRFIFSGLNPATTYYIGVDDTTNSLVSDLLEYATAAAAPAVSANNPAQAGDVVFSHDFSNFIHGGDIVYSAAGYSAASGSIYRQTWSKASGENPVDDGKQPVAGRGTEFNVWTGGTTAEYRAALGMTNWARGASGHNTSTRPGYIKVGGGSALATLYTPELSTLTAGATIRVSFSASAYAEGANVYGSNIIVTAVDGASVDASSVASGGTVVGTETVDVTGAVGEFKTYTVTFSGVSPTTRISFGSDPAQQSANKTRFLLDDVVITVMP